MHGRRGSLGLCVPSAPRLRAHRWHLSGAALSSLRMAMGTWVAVISTSSLCFSGWRRVWPGKTGTRGDQFVALTPTSRQVTQLSLEAAVLLPKGPVLAVQLSRGLQTLTVAVRRGSCPGRESRQVTHVGGSCFQSCPFCISKDTVPPSRKP